MDNNFVWADLSTFDLEIAENFYSDIFGWRYSKTEDEYFTATISNRETSGLYATPEKFRKMNMSSFGMAYIRVENLEITIQKAKDLGGIIELIDVEQQVRSL